MYMYNAIIENVQLKSLRREIEGRMKSSVEAGKTVSSEVHVHVMYMYNLMCNECYAFGSSFLLIPFLILLQCNKLHVHCMSTSLLCVYAINTASCCILILVYTCIIPLPAADS